MALLALLVLAVLLAPMLLVGRTVLRPARGRRSSICGKGKKEQNGEDGSSPSPDTKVKV
jgi:hypothetical protein